MTSLVMVDLIHLFYRADLIPSSKFCNKIPFLWFGISYQILYMQFNMVTDRKQQFVDISGIATKSCTLKWRVTMTAQQGIIAMTYVQS